MKHFLFAALLLLSACAGPDWITYPIDQHVTVQLPAMPQVVDFGASGVNKAFKYQGLSHTQAFTVGNSHAKRRYLISVNTAPVIAEVKNERIHDSLYNQGIAATLHLLNKGRLLRKTSFSTPAGKGVDVVFSMISSATGKQEVLYNRSLFAHHKTYSFGFLLDNEDSIASNEQHRRFFNSIIVKP
jgi:hypothetical protein